MRSSPKRHPRAVALSLPAERPDALPAILALLAVVASVGAALVAALR